MTEQNNFTDEQLVAFLDGEFEHTPAEEIKAALAHSDELNARLKQLTLNKSAMSDAFGALNQTAPSYEDIMGVDEAQTTRDYTGFMKIAAVAIVAAGIGIFASPIIQQDRFEDWHEYVAAYQALYSTETLVHVNNSQTVAEDELKRVISTLEKDISIADLQIDEKLEYKRGQVLEYQGRPLVQLAFLSSDGAPVALCIMKSQSQNAANVSTGEIENMQSAYWSSGSFDYMLIGPISATEIENYATEFSQRL
jgi:anti-sigma factor RsiW